MIFDNYEHVIKSIGGSDLKHISALTSFIFNHFGVWLEINYMNFSRLDLNVDRFIDYEDLPHTELYVRFALTENHERIIETSESYSDYGSYIKDKNRDDMVCGHPYELDYSLGKTEPEKYPDIVAYLTDHSSPYMHAFVW